MAREVGNWIGEVTTTIGTGDITLGGSIDKSYAKFSDEIGNGNTVPYTILDGLDRESGEGTFRSATNILERTTVYSTLTNGVYAGSGASAINLSGSAKVFCTINKEQYEEILDNHLALEPITQNNSDCIGVSNAANLGTFTGSTIPDSNTIKQALQALETFVEAISSGFSSLSFDVQTFGVNGTWTRPANTKVTIFIVQAAGGGGQGADAANDVSGAGGGGGSARVIFVNSPAASYTVTIGTGGTGGASPAGAGTDGGNTIITGLVTAFGGKGAPRIGNYGGASGSAPGGGFGFNVYGGMGEPGIFRPSAESYALAGGKGGSTFLGGGVSTGEPSIAGTGTGGSGGSTSGTSAGRDGSNGYVAAISLIAS